MASSVVVVLRSSFVSFVRLFFHSVPLRLPFVTFTLLVVVLVRSFTFVLRSVYSISFVRYSFLNALLALYLRYVSFVRCSTVRFRCCSFFSFPLLLFMGSFSRCRCFVRLLVL